MKQAKSPWSWMVRGSRWGALQCRLLFLMSVMAASACSNIDENPPSDDGGQNKVGNNLPDVSAGEDFTPAEYLSEFTLDGNAWDEEDGSTVSVLWSQVSGPDSVTIMAPSQPTTQVKTGVFTQSPGQFTFRLTATDKDGGSSFDDVVVTVPKPQLIISAGDNISVNSGDEVTLHADVGFPDPAVQKTIVWQKVTDTVVTGMSGTTTEDLHFSAPSVSVTTDIRFDVTASVTISDETETVSDTVTVTVNPNPNASPVVNAGGDRSVVSGSSVQITAIASDTDGSIDSYAWSRVSGPSVTLLGSATPTVSFTAPTVSVNDNLTLRLTVTDNDGVDASDDVIITILPVNSNQPPTVTADDDQLVNGGDPVTLSAVATDDGSIAAYLWSDETVNGPAISLSGEQTANVSFTAPQVNQRTVLTLRVTVTDDQGVVASDDVMVTINAPPHADAGADQQAEAGSSVTLTGNGSDTDGNVTTYLWTQTGTPQVPLINADRPSAEFITPDVTQATELSFQLTVTDNDGATASDTVIVTVNPLPPNQPPIALAGEDQAVNPGDVITLSGAGEDSDGSITGYLWAHSPGQNQEPVISLADPQLQTVTFTAPAVSESTTLTFTLTVTDDAGDTGTDTVVVTVHPLATLSGTITSANATLIDSDTNAEGTTPVANNPYEKSQHIPNPVTLGGYVHREGVGPVGSSNNGGAVDAEDVYHVNLAPGQVVTIYLGESYSTSDTQPTIEAWLTNDYTSAADYVRYDYEPRSSSGAIILTAPVANSIPPPPADGHYLINILAGDNSAYSYVLTVGSAASAQSNGWSAQQDFVPYELIVDFKESEQSGPLNSKQSQVSLAQRAASVGMEALGGAPGRSMLLGFADPSVKANAFATLGIQNRIQPAAVNDNLQAKIDTISAAVAMQQRPDVASVRLNYIFYPTAVPNDSLFARQWHYPLIHLPQAWDTTTGSADVTVAVIDTGILPNHPDIDNSRLVDGYDFIRSASNAGDGDGIDPNPQDPGDGGGVRASSFHGTHVAGTIAANTNNNLGVAGVAWQVNIMPLRVLGLNGGTTRDIEQAIRYAAQLPNDSGTVPSRKADVINLSLGGPGNTTSAPQAYTLARNAGVIIVAAAGNDGSSQISTPAAYDGVVSVSAVTVNKQRASYSNYGSTIDIAAPGGDYSDSNGDGLPDAVWSTRGNDSGNSLQYTYDYAAGTSMASPHVAGVVALMKSVYPGLTPTEFDAMLSNGDLTEDLGAAGRDNNFGYGLIDAQKAVAAALAAAGGTPPPPEPGVLAVTPAELNFGSQLAVIEINVSNSGAGTLTISDITEDSGGWLSITPVTVDAQGLGLYAINANRDGLAQGLFSASISVVSDNGSVDIPVTMQVFPTQVVNDAGPQVVELIDINTQQVVQSLRLVPNGGVYDFSFDSVRLGVYQLRSSSDLDNDGTLCELGESCGAYPTLNTTVSSEIQVDGSSFDINGLDFETGFQINVIAQ